MLPALPTGRQCTSGARPSASTISNAAVFWPSMRTGLTELTSATRRVVGGDLAGQFQAVVEVAVDLQDLGAVHDGLRQLAHRDLALRDQHRAGDARRGPRRRRPTPRCCRWTRTARACWPRASASVTAIVMPRSLNEPVGLSALDLEMHLCSRCVRTAAWRGSSGVPPSSRVTIVPAVLRPAAGRGRRRSGPGHGLCTRSVVRSRSFARVPSTRSTLVTSCTTSRSASAAHGFRQRGVRRARG